MKKITVYIIYLLSHLLLALKLIYNIILVENCSFYFLFYYHQPFFDWIFINKKNQSFLIGSIYQKFELFEQIHQWCRWRRGLQLFFGNNDSYESIYINYNTNKKKWT